MATLSSPTRQQYLFGTGLVFLAAICYSSKAIWIKLAYGLAPIDATSLLVLRMFFSLPFYLYILSLDWSAIKEFSLSRKEWISVLALGLTGYYIASLADFTGLQYIPAGIARLILFVYPTIVVLIAAWWYKRAVSRIQIIALLLTYLGLFGIFWEQIGQSGGEEFWRGAFWVVIAAITYSIYLVGSETFIARLGARPFTSVAMMSASMGIFVHYLAGQDFTLHTYPMGVYGLGLGMAIFATVIPSFMVSYGIKIIGSGNMAIISSAGPVSTLVMAYFILGETLSPLQMMSTLVVLGGVFLIGLKK